MSIQTLTAADIDRMQATLWAVWESYVNIPLTGQKQRSSGWQGVLLMLILCRQERKSMEHIENNSVKSTKIWNACGYVRLSHEDSDREESNSVKGQKDLIRDFSAGIWSFLYV